MSQLDDWYNRMVAMGRADTQMLLDGVWQTPRQYYASKR